MQYDHSGITRQDDGTVEAFFAIEGAWHHWGKVGDSLVWAKEAAEISNTNFEVETRPAFMQKSNGEFVRIPNSECIARKDNDFITGKSVTEKYTEIQNHEGDALLDEVFGRPACDAAFSLRGGEKVIRMMNFSEWNVKLGGNDSRHAAYLAAVYGHDGITGFSLIPTDIRGVCENTYRMIISASGKGARNGRVGKDGITIRHSARYAERLEAAKKALLMAKKMQEIHAENMWALAKKSLTFEQMKNIFSVCVDKFLPPAEEVNANIVEDILGINSKMKNTELREERREEMRQGFNLWAAWENAQFENAAPSGEMNSYLLFNAISDFCEHKGTYRGNPVERAENEFLSRMSGKADDMKQFALQTVANASGLGSLFA